MESLVYVGMDVHKDTYSLCCYTPSDGRFFAEARIDADARLVKKNLEEVGKARPGSRFLACYEAGCLGFSFYKELSKLGIDCKNSHLDEAGVIAVDPEAVQPASVRAAAKVEPLQLGVGEVVVLPLEFGRTVENLPFGD